MTEASTVNSELRSEMLANIGTFFVSISPEAIDLSRLKFYENKFNKFESIPSSEFHNLALETIRAMDLSVDYYYVASRFAKYADLQCDRVYSITFLTKAEMWLTSNKIKDSVEARKKFVEQDPEYTHVKMLKDSWEALAQWIFQKKDIFLQKHMWIKKCMDQQTGTGANNV